MTYPGRGKGKVTWVASLIAAAVIMSMLIGACQSAPAPTPTTAAPAAATAAPAAPTAAAAKPTAAPKLVSVKLGLMPTYTGPIAALSEQYSKAAADYVQWINDQGGLSYKDPKTGETTLAKFDVMSDDNAYDATKSLSVYQKQKAGGVKAIIGYGGIMGMALAELASKDKIPVFTVGALTDAILKLRPQYLLNSGPPLSSHAKVFVKWAKSTWKESRAPKLGLTYFDNPTGQLGIVGVPEYAKSMGFEVLPAEAITEPATDTSIQVRRLMSGKPDFVYATNSSAGFAVLMKDLNRLGLQGQAQWAILGTAYDVQTFQKLADAETNGIVAMLGKALPTETNLPGVQLAQTISQKYQKTAAGDMYVDQIGYSTVMVNAIKVALEKVGADALTGEAVHDALFGTKNIDTGGIFAPLTLSEAKPWVWTKARAVQWKDHKNAVLSDWVDMPE